MRQRNHTISIRLTDAELRMISQKMKKLNLSNREAYLRKMAMYGYCIQLDIPELKKLTSLLGRCSNNLNQYARKANQTGSIYREDIIDLRTRLDEIYDLTGQILARLNALQ